MKKNIQINLCGRLYQIDEDAYQLLSHYTETLRNYFMKQEGGSEIADDIEQELQSNLEREISTVDIGEMVMSRLKDVDEVAYVRFASVYRSFKDINTFMEELSKLLTEK